MGKINILRRAFYGELLKFYYNVLWKFMLPRSKSGDEIPVVVSLTSYGDRVKKIVPYTLLSLLRQRSLPQKIILWLDEKKWNEENLPSKLVDLKPYGVEVKFCKDIRSYTKLIPALREYESSTIVTVDDDLFYSQQMLSELYEAHTQYPKDIVTLNFCYPQIDNQSFCPYSSWQEYHNVENGESFNPFFIFPQGFGGVLYPPYSLYRDVTKEEIFLKEAPYADDIWFYIMGLLQNTKKRYVTNSQTRYYYLDLFRQIKTQDRLHDINVGESKNDSQLNALMNFYGITLKKYE